MDTDDFSKYSKNDLIHIIKSLKEDGQTNIEEEQTKFQIAHVDKEYKNNNKLLVKQAVFNGFAILSATAIVLVSKSNISDFGSSDILNLINNFRDGLSHTLEFLPAKEIPIAMFGATFDGLQYLIEKFGIVGTAIGGKSIGLIINSIRGSKKSLELKSELESLKLKLKELENDAMDKGEGEEK